MNAASATRPPKAGRLWSLNREGPFSAGLVEAFARVVAHGLAQRERAASDPEKAIHELRKSVRRARAVVRLVRGPLGEAYGGLDGALREAVQATSGLRDVDVLRNLVVHVAPAVSPDERPILERLDQLLARRQEEQRGGSVGEAVARAASIMTLLPGRFAARLPRLELADVRAGFADSYRRAKKARLLAEGTRVDEDVHRWRKRVKELRYQLELDPTADEAPERAPWADLAEALGEITDRIVLADTAAELRAELGPPPLVDRFLEGLRDRIAFEVEAALQQSAPSFVAKPGAFAAALLA